MEIPGQISAEIDIAVTASVSTPARNCGNLPHFIGLVLTLLLRRERSDRFPSLFGFQELGVSDDLLVVLKLRQLGAVQILTQPPELRIHIIEIDDADRRLLAPDDAKRLKPIPARDKNVLTIADNARQWRLQPYCADGLRQLGDYSRVVGADRVTEVDLVDRHKDVASSPDEGVHRVRFLQWT
jgi:hypothetical protein